MKDSVTQDWYPHLRQLVRRRQNRIFGKKMANQGDLDLMVSGSNCLLDSTQTVKSRATERRSGGSRGGSARGAVIADVTTESDMTSGIREAPNTSTSGRSAQLSDYEVRQL